VHAPQFAGSPDKVGGNPIEPCNRV
jgi:hypothetical protein